MPVLRDSAKQETFELKNSPRELAYSLTKQEFTPSDVTVHAHYLEEKNAPWYKRLFFPSTWKPIENAPTSRESLYIPVTQDSDLTIESADTITSRQHINLGLPANIWSHGKIWLPTKDAQKLNKKLNEFHEFYSSLTAHEQKLKDLLSASDSFPQSIIFRKERQHFKEQLNRTAEYRKIVQQQYLLTGIAAANYVNATESFSPENAKLLTNVERCIRKLEPTSERAAKKYFWQKPNKSQEEMPNGLILLKELHKNISDPVVLLEHALSYLGQTNLPEYREKAIKSFISALSNLHLGESKNYSTLEESMQRTVFTPQEFKTLANEMVAIITEVNKLDTEIANKVKLFLINAYDLKNRPIADKFIEDFRFYAGRVEAKDIQLMYDKYKYLNDKIYGLIYPEHDGDNFNDAIVYKLHSILEENSTIINGNNKNHKMLEECSSVNFQVKSMLVRLEAWNPVLEEQYKEQTAALFKHYYQDTMRDFFSQVMAGQEINWLIMPQLSQFVKNEIFTYIPEQVSAVELLISLIQSQPIDVILSKLGNAGNHNGKNIHSNIAALNKFLNADGKNNYTAESLLIKYCKQEAEKIFSGKNPADRQRKFNAIMKVISLYDKESAKKIAQDYFLVLANEVYQASINGQPLDHETLSELEKVCADNDFNLPAQDIKNISLLVSLVKYQAWSDVETKLGETLIEDEEKTIMHEALKDLDKYLNLKDSSGCKKLIVNYCEKIIAEEKSVYASEGIDVLLPKILPLINIINIYDKEKARAAAQDYLMLISHNRADSAKSKTVKTDNFGDSLLGVFSKLLTGGKGKTSHKQQDGEMVLTSVPASSKVLSSNFSIKPLEKAAVEAADSNAVVIPAAPETTSASETVPTKPKNEQPKVKKTRREAVIEDKENTLCLYNGHRNWDNVDQHWQAFTKAFHAVESKMLSGNEAGQEFAVFTKSLQALLALLPKNDTTHTPVFEAAIKAKIEHLQNINKRAPGMYIGDILIVESTIQSRLTDVVKRDHLPLQDNKQNAHVPPSSLGRFRFS